MIHRQIFTLLILLIGLQTFVPSASYAQEQQTLGDIFNEDEIDYGNGDEPLTAQFMAKYYYKQCLNTPSITMTSNEKEVMCTCTAAKAAEVLLVDEFKALDQKSKAGTRARGKFIAYAYSPCMPFIMTSIFRNDCKKSKHIDDLIIGKKKVCSCAANDLAKITRLNKVYVIDQALKHHPMSLNPLEHYLQGDGYYAQRDSSINQCKFRYTYERDN